VLFNTLIFKNRERWNRTINNRLLTSPLLRKIRTVLVLQVSLTVPKNELKIIMKLRNNATPFLVTIDSKWGFHTTMSLKVDTV